MGNIPSHMQFHGDWRTGGRRRRSPTLALVLTGLLVGMLIVMVTTGTVPL